MESSIASSPGAAPRAGTRYGGGARGRPHSGKTMADIKWTREHSTHKQRLLHQRAQVDTSTPVSAAFSRPVHASPRPGQAARTAKIQEENMRLLERLNAIQQGNNGAKSCAAWSASRQDSNRIASSRRRRDIEQERIAKENMQLLKRLRAARPTYSREKQLDDYRRSEAIVSRIGRYERTPGATAATMAGNTVAPSVSQPPSQFQTVSAYTALPTDSDTESEDNWLAVASSIVERQQPGEGSPTTIEKEMEVKTCMDDAMKLRKALGKLQSVLKKTMKSCQGLGMNSENMLAKMELATSSAPTCTDRVVPRWAKSAVSQMGAFRDSGAFLRFYAAIHSQMVNELLAVKDHAKAVYVLGRERRDARDRWVRAASQPVDVGSEVAYATAEETRRRFHDLDTHFADDFLSLREHFSSQAGLSVQMVLLQSADYFDGIAAAMRRTSCFADEPWYATVDVAEQKQRANKTSPSEAGGRDCAIPHPPSLARNQGTGVSGGRQQGSPGGRVTEESAQALYSNRSRKTTTSSPSQKRKEQPSPLFGGHGGRLAGGDGTEVRHANSARAMGNDDSRTAYSARTVDLDPSQQGSTRRSSPLSSPQYHVSSQDRLRTKPDPDLPPPSPPTRRGVSEEKYVNDVDSRLRVKPAPALPPQAVSVDDRLAVKPPRAPPAEPAVRMTGVPICAAAEGAGAGDAPTYFPEAELVDPAVVAASGDKTAMGSAADADEENEGPSAPCSHVSSPPAPSAESHSRVRRKLMKKGFSDYLRLLSGDDTSEWGLHPKP